MPIYIGENKLTNLKIGSTTIDKVFVGDTLVYPDNFISDEVVFIIDSGNSIYTYDPLGNALIYRTNNSTEGLLVDIAASSTKLWVNTAFKIIEYNMILSPFSLTFNRTMTPLEGLGSGLCYLDSTHIISNNFMESSGYHTIASYNISTNTPSVTKIFNLPNGRFVSGDILYNPSSNKYIISNGFTGSAYISQFLANGTLEKEIQINYGIESPIYGLYQYNNKLYAARGTSAGEIYEITSSGLSLVRTLNMNIYGAAQKDGIITVELP